MKNGGILDMDPIEQRDIDKLVVMLKFPEVRLEFEKIIEDVLIKFQGIIDKPIKEESDNGK